MISVYDWLKNIVGKRENAGYQHFLLFPKCFQTVLVRVVKTRDCVVKCSLFLFLLTNLFKQYVVDPHKNHLTPMLVNTYNVMFTDDQDIS